MNYKLSIQTYLKNSFHLPNFSPTCIKAFKNNKKLFHKAYFDERNSSNLIISPHNKNNNKNFNFVNKNRFSKIEKNLKINKILHNLKVQQKKKLLIINEHSLIKTPNNWSNSLKLSKENSISFNNKRENNFFNSFSINQTKDYMHNNENFNQSSYKPFNMKSIFKKINNNNIYNYALPISQRIKLLRATKCSIDKVLKDKSNSKIDQYNSSMNETKLSNTNICFSESNFTPKINYRTKPMILKYKKRPKLSVTKYIDINNIKI